MQTKLHTRLLLLPVIICLLVLASCTKSDQEYERKGLVFYGLTSANEIVKYNAKSPGRALKTVTVTGLEANDQLMAIDFRPATGQLYGVSRNSRLYIINPETGATGGVIGLDAFSPEVYGTFVGFDFNPTVDRIRLVTDLGQNLRINPETGETTSWDGSLNPGTPFVVGAAYSNNKAGATSTTLYGIDQNSQKLVKIVPPNNGTVVPVGRLGVVAAGEVGFDISPDNKALASLKVAGGKDYINNLYYIDLKTGEANSLGKLAKPIIGLAIPTNNNHNY
ncbi:MAG: DUF4394 domain-containing protein [Chitinophagaceae bacterium]